MIKTKQTNKRKKKLTNFSVANRKKSRITEKKSKEKPKG